MTCHDRRDKTVACLRSLVGEQMGDAVSIRVFLVDDGSADGTGDAVRAEFPDVELIPGTGSLFWNGGMRLAYERARAALPDFMLWLNDDVQLGAGVVGRMIEVWHERWSVRGRASIIVGSTRDAVTGELTYGGVRRTTWWQRFRFVNVVPGTQALPCDTFHGNCVLVPRAAYDVLGNLDAGFVHAMGDTDYGLRAVRAGFDLWVMPGYAGTCSHEHAPLQSFVAGDPGFARRWARMMSHKGLPWRQWLLLTHRHGGPFWFVAFLSPYAKLLVHLMTDKVSGWARNLRMQRP